jgi:hypothetical protein
LYFPLVEEVWQARPILLVEVFRNMVERPERAAREVQGLPDILKSTIEDSTLLWHWLER